jgi:hypothetical protein
MVVVQHTWIRIASSTEFTGITSSNPAPKHPVTLSDLIAPRYLTPSNNTAHIVLIVEIKAPAEK